jgi:hypothetical protein
MEIQEVLHHRTVQEAEAVHLRIMLQVLEAHLLAIRLHLVQALQEATAVVLVEVEDHQVVVDHPLVVVVAEAAVKTI